MHFPGREERMWITLALVAYVVGPIVTLGLIGIFAYGLYRLVHG
jgi:hypothetical protein